MKKSLIALAVAGALTAPMVAQADATLYGSMRLAVQSADDTALNIKDESSRIGIKGDIDLGLDGTKGLFQWEANISTSDPYPSSVGSAVFSKRLALIGATGDWGTALIGKQYHPHYLLINAPTLVINTADAANGEWAHLGNDWHKRVDNTLAYASPVMGGFQAFAGAVIGANTADNTDDVDGYNIAAKYSANGLTLAASIAEVDKVSGATTSDNETWGLSAVYKMDALTVAARYEDKEYGDGKEADAAEVAVVYGLGDGLNLKARYSKLDHNTKGEGDQWAAEVEQILGQGRVYANYYAFDNDAEANHAGVDALTVGYRVDF